MLTKKQQHWLMLCRLCDKEKKPMPPTWQMKPLLTGLTKRYMLAHIEDITA